MTLLRLRTLEMCLEEASALYIVPKVLMCAHPHGANHRNASEHVSSRMRSSSVADAPSHGATCFAWEMRGSPQNLIQFQPHNQPGVSA